jgi:hypothetical protein
MRSLVGGNALRSPIPVTYAQRSPNRRLRLIEFHWHPVGRRPIGGLIERQTLCC